MSDDSKFDILLIARSLLFMASLAGIHFAVFVWLFSNQFWEVIDVTATSTYFTSLGFHYLVCFAAVQLFLSRIAHWSYELGAVASSKEAVGQRKSFGIFGQLLAALGKLTDIPLIGHFMSFVLLSFFYCSALVFFLLLGFLLVCVIYALARLPHEEAKIEATNFWSLAASTKGLLLTRVLAVHVAVLLAWGRFLYLKDVDHFLVYRTDEGTFSGRTILWTDRGQLVYTDQNVVLFIPHPRLRNTSSSR